MAVKDIFHATDGSLDGYNSNPYPHKATELDIVSVYCKKKDISYGEFQRQLHFNENKKEWDEFLKNYRRK